MNIKNQYYNASSVPWLSIIIPVYNADQYLEKCLKTIQEQTFSDFEVIMADDGSTDKSSDICRKYEQNDPRFRYFRKDNGGSFQTRIFGAEKAAGEYIAFCDADDYYRSKNAFKKIYNEISEHKCEVLQFGHLKKYNHIKRNVYFVREAVNVKKEKFLAEEYPKLLCSTWNASHLSQSVCNKVYHKSLQKNLPASTDVDRVFWGDDMIMNLYLLSSCTFIRFIPDIMYEYRQFSGATSRFSLRTMKDLDCIKTYQCLFLEKYNDNSKNEIVRNLHGETAGWLYYYVRQAANYLNETELKVLIEESLQLPSIQAARQYFIEENKENWDGVYLLRKADPEEYIRSAKEYNKQAGLKEQIKKVFRKIYYSI